MAGWDELESAKSFAQQYREKHGRLPLIIGVRVYEYFGSRVSVVHAEEHGINVTVADGFDRTVTIDREELDLA